jgi:FkbM family methyltransferase
MLIDGNTVKEYLNKYNINIKGILHVGAHKCEEKVLYNTILNVNDTDIIWVDANAKLVEYNKNRGIVHCYNAVLDETERETTFHITNNGESSSILELGDHAQIYPHIVNIETVKMKTTTLDSITKHIAMDEGTWDILNLDIQGAELKALKGFEDWRWIKAIFSEINYREMYKGCALEPEITEFLKSKGFEKVEEVDTGCGWGDALYVKQ